MAERKRKKQEDKISIKAYKITLCQLIVAVIALLGMLFFGFKKTIIVIRSDLHEVGSRITNVERTIERNRLNLTNPGDNAVVSYIDFVSGKTPFFDLNHYIVVTPLKTGDNWIQDGPLVIDTGGIWSGRAQFGSSAVGSGEKFVIRVIATKSAIQLGPLMVIPDDAIFSEPIVVTRR